MKRLQIADSGVATYTVAEGMTHQIDLNAVFAYGQQNPLAQKAIAFSVAHVLRNATAGKMGDDDKAKGYADAREAIEARIKALTEGKWSERKETGEAGESSRSLLSQALAVVMGVTPEEAADFIANEVKTALEEKGIDPEADNDDLTKEQQTEKRKVAAAVRKSMNEDPGVALEMQKLKLARDQAKLAEATKNAEGKTSAFAAAKKETT